MQKTHIMLQGFGAFPINFKALIERSRSLNDPIEWSIICSTGHYVKMYQELLGKDAVLYLHSDMKKYLNTQDILDNLSDYAGNIYRNIESEKRFTKHKKSMRQLKSAAAMYASMKKFMLTRKPTHILFGQIEGLDGMTLISLGKELGIPSLVPTHTRHLGEIFFSPDEMESLPANKVATDKHKEKAREFLISFRDKKTSSSALPQEIINSADEKYSTYQHPQFFNRCLGMLKRLIAEPEMREPDVFRSSILINFPAIAKVLWGARIFFNKRVYDVDSLEKLPKRYAYYPLQYSPESSINTPAPYFIDQTRAIDAIRFALPSDVILVVKEHPVCLGHRKLGFLNKLQKKAGIVLARYDIPSMEISRNAAITFSVTGTAALESFLIGKPSLTLGSAFFSQALGGPTGIDALQKRIQQSLMNPPTENYIIEAISNIYAASAPFIVGSVFDNHSVFSKYSLNKTNINTFYSTLKDNL